MADVNKTAIFTLEIDNASFNREIVDATKQIQDLTHEKKLYLEKQKLGIQLTDEEIITMKKLDAAIAANKKVVADNTKILQKQTEASLAQAGSQKQLMAQYEAASLELKRLGGSFTKATDGTLKLTGSNKELAAETNAVFQRLKEYDAALGKHNLNVGNYGGVLTQLKQKIQELDQQRSIATDPDEVLRLTSEMRKATFEMDKMTGKVDAMGNRVAKNDIKDGFQDATGAAQALTGVLGLLSLTMGQNEKGGEALQKVFMAVAAAQTVLTIAKSKDDIVGTAVLVKTKLLTAAQWAYNNAVAAFGIGALVAGLALIASRMFANKKATDEARQSAEEYYAKLKEAQSVYDSFGKSLIEPNSELERQLKLMEAQGASDIEILGAKRKIIQQQIEAIRLLDNENSSFEARFENQEKEKDLLLELELLDIEYIKNQKEKNKEIREQAWELKALNTEIALLTAGQREQLNKSIFDNILGSSDVQLAFQKLLGVDDKTFAEVWSQVGDATSQAVPGLKGVAQAQAVINGLVDEENTKRNETLKLIEQQKQAAAVMSDVIGNVFSGMLATAEDQQKEFYKNALLGLLDYLEKFLTVKIAETFINEVSSKSFAGVITASILTGLMKAALNGVRGSISGYAEGGLIEDAHGVPIQRSNGDNRLVTVKTGEVVMNENQQAALKQQAGVDIFKRLRVPGFATGGLVLGDGGLQSRAMVSKVNNSFEIRQMVVEAMRSMPHPIVEVTEINAKQAGYRRAEVMSGLQS